MNTLENRILPQLKTRETKTRDAYQQGLVSFNQVVLLQQQQSRTREALVEAQSEQAKRLAKLQTAQGTHPQLKAYHPEKTQIYKPGTEPKNAPFALPVMAGKVHAQPVEIKAQPVKHPEPKKRKTPLKNLVNRLSKKGG
jgi:hypothetical protein